MTKLQLGKWFAILLTVMLVLVVAVPLAAAGGESDQAGIGIFCGDDGEECGGGGKGGSGGGGCSDDGCDHDDDGEGGCDHDDDEGDCGGGGKGGSGGGGCGDHDDEGGCSDGGCGDHDDKGGCGGGTGGGCGGGNDSCEPVVEWIQETIHQWDLTQMADKDAVTLARGESTDITYTITAARETATTDIYKVTSHTPGNKKSDYTVQLLNGDEVLHEFTAEPMEYFTITFTPVADVSTYSLLMLGHKTKHLEFELPEAPTMSVAETTSLSAEPAYLQDSGLVFEALTDLAWTLDDYQPNADGEIAVQYAVRITNESAAHQSAFSFNSVAQLSYGENVLSADTEISINTPATVIPAEPAPPAEPTLPKTGTNVWGLSVFGLLLTGFGLKVIRR